MELRKFRAISIMGTSVPMLFVPVLVGETIEIRLISDPVSRVMLLAKIETEGDDGCWRTFYECEAVAVSKGERWEVQFREGGDDA